MLVAGSMLLAYDAVHSKNDWGAVFHSRPGPRSFRSAWLLRPWRGWDLTRVKSCPFLYYDKASPHRQAVHAQARLCRLGKARHDAARGQWGRGSSAASG